MVAIVGEQTSAAATGSSSGRLRSQSPGGIGRVGAGLHPDARFDLAVADLIRPYRHGTIEMKAGDADMTRRRDGAARPAIGEQRPGPSASDDRRIGFRKDQPTPQWRSHRRDQQPVIASRQAAGDGPAGIAAEAIGDPPFAPLRLREVTADGAREPDRARSPACPALRESAPASAAFVVGPEPASFALEPCIGPASGKTIGLIVGSMRRRRATAASWRRRQCRENLRPNRNS